MTDKPAITPERSPTRAGHPLAEDQECMVRLSGRLNSLDFTAPLAERLEVLNHLTGEHIARLDKEDLDAA